ncbi:MAG: DUF3108 domain-containing protein [Opitutaceae bacterium]|nr:DUF3108 domain-containing protein [Opitutaceae bacterium]
MNPVRLVLFSLIFAFPMHAEPFTALKDGERFRYRTSWGIFSNAGEVTIEAHRIQLDGRSVFRLRTQIASRGFVRGVYNFDDRGELLIDEASGLILSARDEGKSGSKLLQSETRFDYEKRIARHVDTARPERNREFPIPEGDPIDLISALIQTREWNLKVGERRSTVVYFGRDLYPIVITAEQRETLRTLNGQVSTTMLVPRMESEAPRGVFKRGGEIKVWVSESSPRQPVQMQLKLSFGTALLTLAEHSITPASTTASLAP